MEQTGFNFADINTLVEEFQTVMRGRKAWMKLNGFLIERSKEDLAELIGNGWFTADTYGTPGAIEFTAWNGNGEGVLTISIVPVKAKVGEVLPRSKCKVTVRIDSDRAHAWVDDDTGQKGLKACILQCRKIFQAMCDDKRCQEQVRRAKVMVERLDHDYKGFIGNPVMSAHFYEVMSFYRQHLERLEMSRQWVQKAIRDAQDWK